MSEITADPSALRDEPQGPIRKLRGNLGVASIVFMVVAAAAPLGVIGGVVPLGIASGNGAGFPATFVVSTVILLFFAVGFTALTPYVDEAGAFFSYVRTALGFPAGIGIAFVAFVSYVAIEAGVYGLLGPAGGVIVELFGGPALPWWVFAAVAFAVTTFVGYRNIELSSRVLADTAERRDRDRVGAGRGHRLPGRRPRALEWHRQPERDLLRFAGYRAAVRTDQLRRVRGNGDLPRRGRDTGPHDSARDLHRTHFDRCVLCGDQLGVDLRLG